MRAGGATEASLQPLHRHADARLILFVAGRYRERAFGEGEIFEPGDIVVRPAHYAHDGCALDPDARYEHLHPRAAALRAFFGEHGWRARRMRYGGDWRDLARAARDPDAADVLLKTAPAVFAPAAPRTMMERVAIALSESEAPLLGDIAEANNISPGRLTRRFARAFGASPLTYRQQARVQTALRLLADTNTPLSQIAACAGFSDQSHLGRVLRATTGCTPNQLRRQLAA